MQSCIREAEWDYSNIEMDQFLTDLEDNDWDLKYVYLDRKRNRYTATLEHVETVTDQ